MYWQIIMEIEVYNAPPPLNLAVSSAKLLVTVFGCGNYSFKKALSGWEGSGLQTLLAICRNQEKIKGLALALYDKNDPRIAIFGPIAVDENFRKKGIGRKIAVIALQNLKKIGVKAVYLGVKEEHPARSFYRHLGFQEYTGVVMRKTFAETHTFEDDYYKAGQKVQLRKTSWADYPKFQALFSYPCTMKAFDWQSGYLSSKYLPLKKFLGVFPEMMEKHESGKADIKVLIAGEKEAIVGISLTQKNAESNIQGVNLDFFIHDNFLEHSNLLLESSIHNSVFSTKSFFSKCLISDRARKDILENNNFCLNFGYEMEVPGYGKEIINNYEYSGDIL